MSEDIKIENEDEQNLENKLKKLKEQLKKTQKEKEEYLLGWQRAKADFINYKKDDEKRQQEFIQFANQIIIYDILTILDSFDLALKNYDLTDNKNGEEKQLKKGIYLIKSQLDELLKRHGLKTIKTMGIKFNPVFHEAMAEVESKKPSGIILEEFQRGYTLNNKVLRPAKVKVAK